MKIKMTITARIDAVTAIPETHLRADPPAPRSVKIELTGICNYRCSFCALRTREVQPKGNMDFVLFQRITREMREAGVEEIGLFYLGESFSAPDLLVQSIDWCKQELEFPYVFLTTNGSLAKPNAIFECMEAGLDSLKFSVNAADEEQFEAVMGVKAKLFRDSLDNLQHARQIRDDIGFKCGIYASSIQYDGEQAAKMQAMLEREVLPWVDEHYFLPLYQMSMNIDKVKADTGFTATAGNQGRIGALRKPLPCWSAFTEGHVRADGHLSVCCFGSDDKFDAGDLTQQPFMEAWNSEAFRAIRQSHLDVEKVGQKALVGSMCEVCVAWE